MSLWSHEQSAHKVNPKVAVAIGAASLGVTAAGTLYSVWRKRRNEAKMSQAPDEQGGALFSDETIPLNTRQHLAEVAARVYEATFETESGIITEVALRKQISGKKRQLTHSLKLLTKEELIASRPSLLDAQATGYYALHRLVDAVEGAELSELHQAIYEHHESSGNS